MRSVDHVRSYEERITTMWYEEIVVASSMCETGIVEVRVRHYLVLDHVFFFW